jgi:hypothetical protein
MIGEIANGHDAQVERIEIRETEITLHLSHIPLHRAESERRIGVWSCSGTLVLREPVSCVGTWHHLSLWVVDSKLSVGGIVRPLEALFTVQRDVTLHVTWSNGATLLVTAAKSAQMELTLRERIEEYVEE